MIPLILTVILFLHPTVSHANYFIRLENGKEFNTYDYWEEKGQVFFRYCGGIVGFEKTYVKDIKETDSPYVEIKAKEETFEAQKSTDRSLSPQSGTKKNIEDIEDKKDDLAQKLFLAKVKLNQSIAIEDQYGIKMAKKEIQKLQTEMSNFTQESKRKK